MEKRAIKLVILDLGKVFVGFDTRLALQHWAKVAGVDVGVLLGRMRPSADDERFECGLMSQDIFFGKLMNRLGISIPMHELIRGWNGIFTDVITPAYEAAKEIRRKYRLVALSNTNAAHQSEWATLLGEELKVFHHVYTSCDLKMRKPDVAVYKHVLADQGVEPSEAVFFDDLEENIAGARKTGITSIHVTSSHTIPEWLSSMR